jgi:hypothetical protein
MFPLHFLTVTNPDYVGCFSEPVCTEDLNARALTFIANDEQAMTVEQCKILASQMGFAYAAVQWHSQCFGGFDISQYTEAGTCDRPCSGDSSQMCGGSCTNAMYLTNAGKEVLGA